MGGTRLYQTSGVEEQWHSVVAPWLREQIATAWRDRRPTVVLTPGRAESFYLRRRLVRDQISFLGLRFWTPSDARTFLLAENSLNIEPASRAELRLVARACAERLAQESETEEPEPSLSSVAREPEPFLRAYDLLLGAGWNPARESAAYGRRLAAEMARTLAERKIATQAGLHRALRQNQAPEEKRLLANLLVVGFNATHWPLWDLLRATVAASENVTLALLAPRVFGEEIDQLWISSWEEAVGGPVEIPADVIREEELPFASCAASYERGAIGEADSSNLTFLATPDFFSQVHAIVLQALTYLKSDSCGRLGIVFPEENALALGVADQLRRLGVPLDDGTGCLTPGLFEKRPWQTWLQLQGEPSVENLTAWVRACTGEQIGCGLSEETFSARDVANLLDDALGETLVDDLNFLALHFEENSQRRRAPEMATFLRARVQLPESGTFAEFLEATFRALKGLKWTAHLASVQESAPLWLRESAWELSRRTYLEWLRESTQSQERKRGADGNHFYGKVHLLIYAQMPGQTWSHLILTGLNEGQWPRLYEAGAFGSRHELMTLNKQARALNRRGTIQGAQGEGHEAVAAERGHCLLPLERQDLALRDLCAALEGTSTALCLTAMTVDSGRTLLPSDFFAHVYQTRTSRVLDEKAFRALARITLDWCQRQASLLPSHENKTEPLDVEVMRTAFRTRRDATQPFGRYEFAFAAPPEEAIQLPCKTWETAWHHPASVWLENVVGVHEWPQGQLGWPRAVGTWVHRWLTKALKAEGSNPTGKDFLLALRDCADREPRHVRALAERAEVTLYPWWDHVCGQARAIALGLGESLAPQLEDRHFFSEFRLPENLRMALPGTDRADFVLRGQIDLLLIDPGAAPFDLARGNFTDCSCWVIDFKTGAAKNLSAKKIEKGTGLQALLYALAVRTAGAQSVAISLHTFDAPLKPQVQIEQVMGNLELFRSLDQFHHAGIFGMRPDSENEYGFSPAYPMATRPIAADVLEAKWALVHGTGALEEEA